MTTSKKASKRITGQNKKSNFSNEDIASRLVTKHVKIGSDEGQTTFYKGKPFPLVLSPAHDKVNFIQL